MNPLNINFVDLSSPNIDNWLWEFGDGTISTLQNPVHHYPDTGLYLVCLHVSSGIPGTSNYCEDTFCDSILITMAFPPCHANFTIVNNPADPLTFTFINHSFGNFNELLWDFGDGDFSFNYSPTHKYKNPGTYNVCLSVYHINYPTSDTLCVDKQCKQLNIPPPSFYNLAGQVFANFFPVNICNIYLYRLLGNGNIFLTDTAKIDTIGVYYFYQIPAGKYLIKAEPVPNTPLYNKNLPTYYGNVLHWMNGDVINLNSNFFSANVNLLPYQSMGGGSGSIQGKITIEGKYSNKGNPAPHVEILLLNMQNIPVKIDYSDHNGNFKFPDLPFGAYQVYAEIAGKNTIPVQVVLDINNPAVNDINLIITPFAIIASVEENVSENIECIGDIYPNPSDNEAYIDIVMLKTSKVKLNIINCFGQVLISEDNQLTTGKNRTQLNVAGLNTGLYTLQIIEDNKSLVMKRLIKIH